MPKIITRIITIDGPAAAGKSTIAHLLAESLDYAYLDTGLMFRLLAYNLEEAFLEAKSKPEFMLKHCTEHFQFHFTDFGFQSKLLLNKQVICEQELRKDHISRKASQIAQNPTIRQFLCQAQRALSLERDLVADGRDLGSVVFPNAFCKFFLDASVEIRAKRRLLDLEKLGENVELAELEKNIAERDRADRERAIAPLIQAEDANFIDSSYLSIDEVLALMLAIIKEKN